MLYLGSDLVILRAPHDYGFKKILILREGGIMIWLLSLVMWEILLLALLLGLVLLLLKL